MLQKISISHKYCSFELKRILKKEIHPGFHININIFSTLMIGNVSWAYSSAYCNDFWRIF